MNPQVNILLREVKRLDPGALDEFIGGVLSPRENLNHPQSDEAGLLRKINRGLSLAQAQRLHSLNQKRQEALLSESERTELLALVEKSEQLDALRLRHLTVLAQLRNVSVQQLMTQLGIGPANV